MNHARLELPGVSERYWFFSNLMDTLLTQWRVLVGVGKPCGTCNPRMIQCNAIQTTTRQTDCTMASAVKGVKVKRQVQLYMLLCLSVRRIGANRVNRGRHNPSVLHLGQTWLPQRLKCAQHSEAIYCRRSLSNETTERRVSRLTLRSERHQAHLAREFVS